MKAKARLLEKEEERQERTQIDATKEAQGIVRIEKAEEKKERAITIALKRQIQIEERAQKTH